MTQFGQPRRHFVECGSTNDLAREWASDASNPAPSGALVTADFQTRGRGQRGHQWQADTGQSALMSFIYRLPLEADASQLGLVAALAVTDALETLGFSSKIKWPNDILLDGEKAGGILVEAAAGAAILGIGLNVNQTQFAGASEYAYPPTSLRLSGQEQSVETVIHAVSEALTDGEERWRREGFESVLTRCRAVLAAGALVRQGVVIGELKDLSERGAAVVRLADGTFQEWATVN